MRRLKCTATLILFAVAALVCKGMQAQQQAGNSSVPQPFYTTEDDTVPNSIPLPECARAALAHDPHIARLLEHRNLTSERLPVGWFAASAMKAVVGNQRLLVVMGIGEIRGANTSPFWIFRLSGDSCDLLLAISAHHLEFLETSAKGLPDIQGGYASSGNTSEHQLRFDGHEYLAANDSCQPAEAERMQVIHGAHPQMFLMQRPGHSNENLLCEGRAWVWQQWRHDHSFDLKLTLFSKEGDETTTSYASYVTAAGQRQVVIQVRQVLVDRAGAHPPTSRDSLVTAARVERRFALQGQPDRTKVVPESQDVETDSYELYFLDEAGKVLGIL